jgi:hypothetical protein
MSQHNCGIADRRGELRATVPGERSPNRALAFARAMHERDDAPRSQ